MRHIKIYEDFSPVNENSVELYNDGDFAQTGGEPEAKVKINDIPNVIEGLIARKEAGEIDTITIVADIPMQGKRKPAYVDELIQQAKAEVALRARREAGSDAEAAAPSDVERASVMDEIFFDSEFIVDRIEKLSDGIFIVGIPYSLKKKAERDPAFYSAMISPNQIEEIHYE